MIQLGPEISLPPAAVTETFGILAKRGAGKSNAAAVMAEDMLAAGHQVVVVDPVGAWWGLRAGADGKPEGGLPVTVLGGHRGDLPLEPTAGALVADLVVDDRLSCVVDVSAFDSEAEKRRFLIAFAERMFRAKGKPGRDDPVHLFLEEADDYAPQRAMGVDQNRCLGAFERLVKRGRSRGIGATMISQRSASLNKDILTQIDTLIVLRTTSPQDRKAIGEWVRFHGQSDEMLASLSELQAGEAWVWSPEFLGVMQRTQIRRRRTFDSGATPTSGRKARPAVTLSDVDLAQLAERMKATVERAQADDPKLLRRRIAELERKLQAAAQHSEPELRVETVEVPVVSDDLIAELRVVIERLDAIDNTVDTMLKLRAAADRLVSGPPTARPVPVSRPEPRPRAAVPARAPQDLQTATLNGQVSRSQHRLLDALALLEAIGVPVADKKQLALLAGVSPTSGGYFNNLGTLRTAGLIDYPAGGTAQLTDDGRAIADPGDVPRSDDELHQRVFALKNVGPARARILQALIEAYPDAIEKTALAEQIGVSPTSGGYFNNLGSLRTLGLVDYPQRGYVAAEPILFLGGGA